MDFCLAESLTPFYFSVGTTPFLGLCRRNSSKFVVKGFLRLRVDVVNNQVRILVEDSGPGIPPERRSEIFSKYQESLDLLCQGTGIGLNLSKKLMKILKGDLWLDENYTSGIDGCPGACFVVDLKRQALDIESSFFTADAVRSSFMGELPSLHEEEDAPFEMASSAMTLSESNISRMSAKDESIATSTSESTNDVTGKSNSEQAPPDTTMTPKGDLPNQVAETPTAVPMAAPAGQDGSTYSGNRVSFQGDNLPPSYEVLPARVEEAMELPEGLSVLFVDDDAVLRKLFMRAVKKVAPDTWKIRDASSGEM